MATEPTTRRIKAKPTSATKSEGKIVSVTVGELRSNFKAVEAKLGKGMKVQITRRGAVIAEMLPPATQPAIQYDRPDFKARLRRIWGDTPLDIDTTAIVSEGRSRDLLP